MNKRNTLLSVWVVIAAILTTVIGLVYVSVQQSYRQSANDPQIEINEEISAAIANGAPADQLIPTAGGTDIKTSLSAFAMIFDQDGKVLGSSAKLNDADPVPPKAVLDAAKDQGRSLITWEPEKGVRIATVISSVQSGDKTVFVLAGKNMREVENRIGALTYASITAWIISLLLAVLLVRALDNLLKLAATGSTTIEQTEVVIVEETSPKQDNA
ncbi:MAG: hypothetical protein KBD66_04360 [Candidatus Doudnabacteria bacterium]|nr:hypothetical protein [Candidatus Doudnabacteria bacterium]